MCGVGWKVTELGCVAEPSAGEEVFAPRFVEKLQPKHVPDGATVQFECQVEGNPRPQITWFRQTAIIKPSQDFQVPVVIKHFIKQSAKLLSTEDFAKF